MSINQTRADAIELVVGVIQDGQRSDRYLRRTEAGEYYTTDAKGYIDDDGPYNPPHVNIPWSGGDVDSDDDLGEWASELLDELDLAIEQEDKDLMALVLPRAKADAKLFLEEYDEVLDPTATDWDAIAWGEAKRELKIRKYQEDRAWEIYQACLVSETENPNMGELPS